MTSWLGINTLKLFSLNREEQQSSNSTLTPKDIVVIGAGFGRTGTASLKSALELLLAGRCYHMVESFRSKHSCSCDSSFHNNYCVKCLTYFFIEWSSIVFRKFGACPALPMNIFRRSFCFLAPCRGRTRDGSAYS